MSRLLVGDVSDTARWVAYFRGRESGRADRLFDDPHALRLAGERGKTIAQHLPKGPLPWSLAIRTRVFDELILRAVREDGVDLVLNLAAGLDARPYRLPLPSTLRWVEVDIAHILAEKAEALASERAACAVERLAADLSDAVARRRVLERACAGAERVLVVTEGLLAYLDEPTVGALADDLRALVPNGRWLLDNVAPDVLRRLKRSWDRGLRPGNAEMRFAPAAGLGFFEAHGFRTLTTRSLLDEAERLGREMPIVRLVRRVSRFVPPLGRAYARRQAELRHKVVYALLEAAPATGTS